MADLFDVDRESAALQAAIERARTGLQLRISEPSSEPLFRVNHAGDLTDRLGNIIRPAVPALVLGKPNPEQAKS